jgi:hypothetical protein
MHLLGRARLTPTLPPPVRLSPAMGVRTRCRESNGALPSGVPPAIALLMRREAGGGSAHEEEAPPTRSTATERCVPLPCGALPGAIPPSLTPGGAMDPKALPAVPALPRVAPTALAQRRHQRRQGTTPTPSPTLPEHHCPSRSRARYPPHTPRPRVADPAVARPPASVGHLDGVAFPVPVLPGRQPGRSGTSSRVQREPQPSADPRSPSRRGQPALRGRVRNRVQRAHPVADPCPAQCLRPLHREGLPRIRPPQAVGPSRIRSRR